MATETGDRMKIVIYYAVWATACAAAAGVAISLIHTWFFSYNPGKSWLVHTLVSDILAAALLAAGQGAVALVVGLVMRSTLSVTTTKVISMRKLVRNLPTFLNPWLKSTTTSWKWRS